MRQARINTVLNEDLEVESITNSDQFNHFVDDDFGSNDVNSKAITAYKVYDRNEKGLEIVNLRRNHNASPVLAPGSLDGQYFAETTFGNV